MIYTTLSRIREHLLYGESSSEFLSEISNEIGDDEPLSFAKITEVSGLPFALWCCRAEPQHAKTWRLYAVWCARQVQHLMRDPRSIAAIDVAELYANGLASDEELSEAWVAARAAAWAARSSEQLWLIEDVVCGAVEKEDFMAALMAHNITVWAVSANELDAIVRKNSAKFLEMLEAA